MNKLLITLSLFLLGLDLRPNQAVDDLVLRSGILKTNIDFAIKGIAGFREYQMLGQGAIAPADMLMGGYIKYDDWVAYLEALENVQNTTFYSAEDFLQDQQQGAQENFDSSVDDFVEATLAIVTVLAVEEQATKAQETGDIADQEALQDFIADESVFITEDQIDAYNSAISDLQEYGNQVASFTAVLSNEEYLSQFQASADEFNNSFLDALATFDATVGLMTVAWEGVSVSVDLASYYKSSEDFFLAGEQNDFYTTSPIACGYDFSQCQ